MINTIRALFILILVFGYGQTVSQCNYSVVLYDTYGDGWNGGEVTILSGSNTYGPFTLNNGGGPQTFTFLVNSGEQIYVTYSAGWWPEENEYYIFDSDGNQIFHDGPDPVANNTLIGTGVCPSCPSPFNLTVTNLTLNSAELNWTEPATATEWGIQYGLLGFPLGTGTVISGITSKPYSLSGLAAATSYSYYVRSVCGSGDTSNWAGPFNFSTLVCLPSEECMYILDMQDLGNSWNGANITVYQNGISQGSFTVFGGGVNIDTVWLCNNANITLSWSSGLYDNETIFQLIDPMGTVIFSWTAGNNPSSGVFFSFISQCTPPTCPAPVSLNATNINDVSASLGWTENGTATLWEIQYGLSGFIFGTGTIISNITTNPFLLSGLTPSTAYQFYVRSVCGPSDTSNWTGPFNFTTLACLSSEQCMYILDMQDLGNSWNGADITVYQNGISQGSFTVLSGGANIETVLLCNNSNITLSWDSGMFDDETSFQLIDPMGTVIYSWTAGNNPSPGVFFSFIAQCTPPTCPAPVNLNATNINDVSAFLGWTENGTATLWEIQYGLSGFIFGTGTFVTGITTNPYSLTGLTPSTAYQFYVRSVCGPSDTSNWAGPYSFTTSASVITNPSVCGLQIPIPDNNCAFVSINVTGIPGSQLGVSSLLDKVRIIANHTWDGDLAFSLVSPNGVEVNLSSGNGGNGNNYGNINGICDEYTEFDMSGVNGNITAGTPPYIGSFVPEGDFNDFNDSSNPNGYWTLKICDIMPNDTGSLQFVQLVFEIIVPPVTVLINEVDCDQGANDTLEFAELYDGGVGNYPLDGFTLVFYDGFNDKSYMAFGLDGYSTDSAGYFVIGNPGIPGATINFPPNSIQDGTDAVALYKDSVTSFPNGTSVTLVNLVDAIVYETNDPYDLQLLPLLNPGQPQVDEDFLGMKDYVSCSRLPNGSGGLRNTVTYKNAPPTPLAVNSPMPELVWQSTAFFENILNDGSLSNSIPFTLKNLTFSSTGTFTDGIEFTSSNTPAGLTSQIVILTDTTGVFSLTGNAFNHLSSDNINNLGISFHDIAFAGLPALFVAGNPVNNFSVSFIDFPPPFLTWTNDAFYEITSNNGSTTDTVFISLTNDLFSVNNGSFTQTVHYNVLNTPPGMTLNIEAVSSTSAIVTISGNAASHTSSDNIYNLTVIFLDSAFVISQASEVMNYTNDSLKIIFIDPYIHDISPVMSGSDTTYICNYCSCNYPYIFIYNYGPSILTTTDTIFVSYLYPPSGNQVYDTIIPQNDLLPSDSMIYFPSINITQPGIYSFSLVTYINTDNNQLNDSTSGIIYAYELTANLGGINDTLTVNNYPYILTPAVAQGPFPVFYLWSDGSTNSQFTVTDDGWWHLTVTDTKGCVCHDSVFVTLNPYNTDLIAGTYASDTTFICINCQCNFPEFYFINSGPNPLYNTDTIYFNYLYYPLTVPATDTIVLSDTLWPGDTIFHTPALNITDVGFCLLTVSVTNSKDVNHANDTVVMNLYAYQITVDLGGVNDTIAVNDWPWALYAGNCTSPFGCSYFWSTGSENIVIGVMYDGWYSLTVTDGIGCSASNSVYVYKPDNINETSFLPDVSVFPNPVTDYLKISFDINGHYVVKAGLYSISNKLIKTSDFSGSGNSTGIISMSEITSGVYLLKLSVNDRTTYFRILKL